MCVEYGKNVSTYTNERKENYSQRNSPSQSNKYGSEVVMKHVGGVLMIVKYVT